MEKSQKMVEEITIRRRMTRKVKGKLQNRIFLNCILAILIMLYIGAINVVYVYLEQPIAENILKWFAITAIVITLIVFEIAYHKDSGKLAIIGIELMIFSIIFLYIPKIYENLDKEFCIQLTFIPIFCAIYYVGKSILIYIKTEKQYQNNLSDVKQIVKEDEEGESE